MKPLALANLHNYVYEYNYTVPVSVCMVDVLTYSCVWLVCDGNGGHCKLFQ